MDDLLDCLENAADLHFGYIMLQEDLEGQIEDFSGLAYQIMDFIASKLVKWPHAKVREDFFLCGTSSRRRLNELYLRFKANEACPSPKRRKQTHAPQELGALFRLARLARHDKLA